MRTFSLITVVIFASSVFAHAQSQDVDSPPVDTARINDVLRSGSLGPMPFSFMSWQDNIMGSSPDAARMAKYVDTPMSYAFGLAEISIPIYEIKTKSLSLPVALTYDCSGIKPEDIAGIVGLGWSLHAGGVISRQIIGRPDDGEIPSKVTDPNSAQLLSSYAGGLYDTDYDVYNYSFCGHSGAFYILPNIDGVFEIVPTEPTELIIERTNQGFLITDTEGVQYSFTQLETSSRIVGSADPNAPPLNNSSASYNMFTVTSWHLTEIRSFDGKDSITFRYDQSEHFSHGHHSYYRSVSFPYQYLGNGSYRTNFSGGFDPTPTITYKEWSMLTTYGWTPQLVKRIIFNGGELTFQYSSHSYDYPRQSYPVFCQG